MIDQENESQFDKWLRGAAQSYHAPRPTPAQEMWEQIAAERVRRRALRRRLSRLGLRWGLAAAALIALGIGIGRWTAPATGPVGNSPALARENGGELAYRIAATQCLSGAEAFLTGFRADVRDDQWDARSARQAGELLSTARLLLDSPAGRDARLRALLEELELVLVQIAQLAPGPADSAEINLITQGMEQRGVLIKLRSAIPAGPPVRQAQGVS